MFNFNFINEAVEEYAAKHSPKEDQILAELNRETNIKHLYPRMLSGPLQIAFLSFIIKLIRAKNVLELGTYTGYSAIAMARALTAEGHLDTVEVQEELKGIQDKYFKKSGQEEKISSHFMEASTFLSQNKKQYDFIFLDADKVNYPNYYEPLINCLVNGGLLVADNVLWSGKVLEPDEKDKQLQGILAFNEKAHKDSRTESMIITLRDGLHLIRKIQ